MTGADDEREAGGESVHWGQAYHGSDMVIRNMARGASLSRVLGSLGYDIKQTCFPSRRLVICRGTMGVEFDGDAAACWRWLFESGKLAEYVAKIRRRQRMEAARCAPKNNQLRLFR